MFAVIYRNYVKPHLEEAYQEYWEKVATYFVQHCGALGSTLHKTQDGMWVAYSRWPDKATRDASWSTDTTKLQHPLDILEAITALKSCFDEEKELPEIIMEIKNEVS